eukprot:5935060-Pleurochrysis_carterae.AAC.1
MAVSPVVHAVVFELAHTNIPLSLSVEILLLNAEQRTRTLACAPRAHKRAVEIRLDDATFKCAFEPDTSPPFNPFGSRLSPPLPLASPAQKGSLILFWPDHLTRLLKFPPVLPLSFHPPRQIPLLPPLSNE